MNPIVLDVARAIQATQNIPVGIRYFATSDSDYWKGIDWDNIDGGIPYCNECEQWADDDSHCTECSACYIDLDKGPDMPIGICDDCSENEPSKGRYKNSNTGA